MPRHKTKEENEQAKKKIRTLLADGLKHRAIVERVGCSLRTINNVKKQMEQEQDSDES